MSLILEKAILQHKRAIKLQERGVFDVGAYKKSGIQVTNNFFLKHFKEYEVKSVPNYPEYDEYYKIYKGVKFFTLVRF